MNVKELRAALAEFPDDMLVIASKDSEGNHYSPVAELDERMYVPITTWFGETYMPHEQLTRDGQYHSGYSEEDEAPEGAERVLCLWPVD